MQRDRSRQLRANPTDAERALWFRLRYQQIGGHRFRRQHPIGPYIVDFVCLEQRLVIEVDGSQHLDQLEYDAARDIRLAADGFHMLRFDDREVLLALDGVVEKIWLVLPHEEYPPP